MLDKNDTVNSRSTDEFIKFVCAAFFILRFVIGVLTMMNKVPYEKDINVVMSDINNYVRNYINLWLDGDDKILSEPNTLFAGLLNYLKMNYFNKFEYDYRDVDYLNNLFNIYTSLCYKYNKYPMFDEFINTVCFKRDILYNFKNNISKFTGDIYYTDTGMFIDDINEYINNIIKSNSTSNSDLKNNNNLIYDSDGNIDINCIDNLGDLGIIKKPSTIIFEAVKDWEKECEMALRRGTAENNKIGSMFILKAKYGYRETAPVPAPETLQVLPTSELPKLNIKKTPPKIQSGAED